MTIDDFATRLKFHTYSLMSSLSLYKDSKNPHVAIDVCLTRLYVFVDAVDVSEERLKNHMSA